MTLNKKGRYWEVKEEVLERTVWRIRFGKGCGRVEVRQTV